MTPLTNLRRSALHQRRHRNRLLTRLFRNAAEARRLSRHAHPALLDSVNNLAAVLIGLGELDIAAERLDTHLADCRATLGRRHPETFKAAWQLLVAESRRGDPRGRVRELLDEDLAPLIEADPDGLPAELRALRAALAEAGH